MATKANFWGGLSGQDLNLFLRLVSDERLNVVFYPVPGAELGIGGLGSWINHGSHPLHPNHIPKKNWVNETGGLLGLKLQTPEIDLEGEQQRQAQRIAEHWLATKANKVFQLLNKDTNFRKAQTVFEQKRGAAQDGDLYAHAFAEFRFLETVVSNVGFFLLTDGRAFNWPTPDKKKICKARGHAWAMLDAFDMDGVELADHGKQFSLKALLSELADQLDVQCKSGRAAWGGKNRPYRVLIQNLANALLRYFGEASPEIVLSLAAMIACPFTERTINNQLNDSRGKHRQALGRPD